MKEGAIKMRSKKSLQLGFITFFLLSFVVYPWDEALGQRQGGYGGWHMGPGMMGGWGMGWFGSIFMLVLGAPKRNVLIMKFKTIPGGTNSKEN
jgi:hypothetical protein